MKKGNGIGWMLALSLLLTGCTTQRTTVESGVGMPKQEKWSYELSARQERGESCAEDGRVVATYCYEVPQMAVFDETGTPYDLQADKGEAVQAAEKFNDYFEQWLQEKKTWFDDLAASAAEDYAACGQEESSLWCQEDYAYTDEVSAAFWHNTRLICVKLEQYSFTGGVHGYTLHQSKLFDGTTGENLQLSDLLSDYAGLQTAVEQEILRQMQTQMAQRGEDFYFSDYAETVKNWMEREIFFDNSGMTVVFAVYDIAPYAAGEQSFTISYDMIKPFLNDYGRELLGLTE